MLPAFGVHAREKDVFCRIRGLRLEFHDKDKLVL